MRQYLLRRFLLAIPTLFLVSITIFLVLRVIPGDVAMIILSGSEGSSVANPQQMADLRHKLGLDQTLPQQYISWATGILRLDPGRSLKTDRPIADEIAGALPVTLELIIFSTLVSFCIAIPLGVLSAMHQDTELDYIFRVATVGGLAMPVFWTATLVILILTMAFNWMPPLGFVTLFEDPLKNIQQMVWPVLVLGYYQAAVLGRMTRSQMLEVLRQDYVRTARAKGLRDLTLIYAHALKNALLPIVTLSGLQFGVLIGGTMLLEIIFVLPGLGTTLVESILSRDYPIVQTIVLLIAVLQVLVNLAVDITYAWLDPRIRYT